MPTHRKSLLHTLSRLLRVPPAALAADTRFREDLGLADWELVWLVNQLERSYRVEISDTALSGLTTPRALEPLLYS